MRIKVNPSTIIEVEEFSFGSVISPDGHKEVYLSIFRNGDDMEEYIGYYDLDEISYDEARKEADELIDKILIDGYVDLEQLRHFVFC